MTEHYVAGDLVRQHPNDEDCPICAPAGWCRHGYAPTEKCPAVIPFTEEHHELRIHSPSNNQVVGWCPCGQWLGANELGRAEELLTAYREHLT